ncbi:uncharacterized protein N7483_003020 [Penicillium malachiteum]|uniref:uncharacterized protein n=1 Tax=Penicillium malachiteum TaxID=1324776 RepID=UPI0025499025|nr:uncharacterized protein N7483_003020 [Penicillium malachiteum]KAJ5737895.1 hypothetical protein N7483_003020 [Penicillium malachiteum]
MINHLELCDALDRAISKKPEKRSRLAPYFDAIFEFQSPYQSPSPSPPSSYISEPNSPIRETESNVEFMISRKILDPEDVGDITCDVQKRG